MPIRSLHDLRGYLEARRALYARQTGSGLLPTPSRLGSYGEGAAFGLGEAIEALDELRTYLVRDRRKAAGPVSEASETAAPDVPV